VSKILKKSKSGECRFESIREIRDKNLQRKSGECPFARLRVWITFAPTKTVHFRNISGAFGNKTIQKSPKTFKTVTPHLTQTTIAQKNLTYLTHLNAYFARLRAYTFMLFL